MFGIGVIDKLYVLPVMDRKDYQKALMQQYNVKRPFDRTAVHIAGAFPVTD